MKQGLVCVKKRHAHVVSSLEKEFQLKSVSRVANLRQALFKNEFDFIFVETDDIAFLMKAIMTVYELDKDLVIITQDLPEIKHKIPMIENLYYVSLRLTADHIKEILSFHQARLQGLLQVDCRHVCHRKQNYFFLPESLPIGIILTDAEESIFYINQKAIQFIDYKSHTVQIKEYLNLRMNVSQFYNLEVEMKEDVYECVVSLRTGVNLHVRRKKIYSNKVFVGSIYYLEDVSIEHKRTEAIRAEKKKYERLTGRLNEVLLHELDTKAYHVSYFKRKLDIEIKHAQKDKSDVVVFYLYISQLEERALDYLHKRQLISQATSFLLEKFPEPYIVGHVPDGHWLIISLNDFLCVEEEFDLLTEQFKDFVKNSFNILKIDSDIQVHSKVLSDLRQFKNSDEVFDVLGVD